MQQAISIKNLAKKFSRKKNEQPMRTVAHGKTIPTLHTNLSNVLSPPSFLNT